MGAAEAGPSRGRNEGSLMRKLIVSSFVSLDGVIDSPMTWTSPFFDDESKEYAYKQLADVEFFLLGRVTYDVFSARWPQIRGDKYFDRINGLKKLVASTTLKDLTWNASVISGEVGATLRALKEQSGGAILKYGVSQLDRTLLANRLVDEYNLWIVPTVVRQGKRAFEDVAASLPKLDLVDVRRFNSGSAILRYSPRY
jgi:dihydrofolate reductase